LDGQSPLVERFSLLIETLFDAEFSDSAMRFGYIWVIFA
jgi:hypothetical protein